jgi:tetratricopeptide (TPR) repeat protein
MSSTHKEVTLLLGEMSGGSQRAPEQLKGETITTASDVYSLGVVLYELLTGERPFQFKNPSLEEAVHVVCESDPIRSSEAAKGDSKITNYELREATNGEPQTETRDEKPHPKSKIQNLKSLKGDLDTIVLQALRKEPERRYKSVPEFAEDIERYLQGLPVKARPNTFTYRAGKFVSRNKIAAAASFLIFLTLIGGIAATVWQAHRAEQQRIRAEKRFDDVRKLSHSLMFEIHDSMQNLPGATPTRQLIVSRALDYLDSLAQESGGDPTLQRELATAYEKIGDIRGNPYLSNLGDSTGALESYRRALEIRESLLAADPNNIAVERETASNYDHIGDVLGRTGDRKGAAEIIQKAIEIRRKLIAENSADNDLRRELATSRLKIGEHLQSGGDINAGLENERQALATFESLAAQDPQNAKILRSVMLAENKIGYMLFVSNDLPGALEIYRNGLAIAETLAAKDADNAPSQRDLSLALNNVSRILLKFVLLF